MIVCQNWLISQVRMWKQPRGTMSSDCSWKWIESQIAVRTPFFMWVLEAVNIWGKCFKVRAGILAIAKCVSWIRRISALSEQASPARDDHLKGELRPHTLSEVNWISMLFQELERSYSVCGHSGICWVFYRVLVVQRAGQRSSQDLWRWRQCGIRRSGRLMVNWSSGVSVLEVGFRVLKK